MDTERKPTLAELLALGDAAVAEISRCAAQMRRDLRDIYRLSGVPLPDNLKESPDGNNAD